MQRLCSSAGGNTSGISLITSARRAIRPRMYDCRYLPIVLPFFGFDSLFAIIIIEQKDANASII